MVYAGFLPTVRSGLCHRISVRPFVPSSVCDKGEHWLNNRSDEVQFWYEGYP